jgi:hypothetical protein
MELYYDIPRNLENNFLEPRANNKNATTESRAKQECKENIEEQNEAEEK